MTIRKPLLEALGGAVRAPAPIWLMRQAGRYLPEYRAIRSGVGDFLELCQNPDLAAEVTLQPLRRFGFDAAIVFSDILVVPHALGQSVRYVDGEGPVLARWEEVHARLDRERAADFLVPCYETLRRVRAALPGGAALIGFSGAPWTVAAYMIEGGGSRDFAKARAFLYRDERRAAALFDLLVDVTAEYLIGQISAGAEVVQIFDTWAGLLPEAYLRRWSLEPIQEIICRVKAAYPSAPVIVFPRGAGPAYVDFARTSGADAVSLDASVPLGWARDVLQPVCAVQGNLDPVALLAGGGALERGTRRILDTLSEGSFVFNLGHGILPETPVENVTRLVEIVRGIG